jgi:MoxR-like ATPase
VALRALDYSDKDRYTATRLARLLIDNVQRVIRGNRRAVEIATITLFAGGHLLIDDVPGVGKTMLGRSLACSISGTFKRIQATPDLLPADITGSGVFRSGTGDFEFICGPLFANVVMFDEINRATPRTQSALLEAMDENAITVDGVRHLLPDPFFVLATQNPSEHHGTFPLPEGELDRFTIAISLGYVDRATERDVIKAQLQSHPIDELSAAVTTDEVAWVRTQVRKTYVSDVVLDYALALTAATRKHPQLELGASPRAAISLVRCAQARALVNGRDYVLPDDVQSLAIPALAHRIVGVFEHRLEPNHGTAVIHQVLRSVPVPVAGPPPPS